MAEGKFITAINCMDGRVQEPIIMWGKIKHGANYIDVVTEAGPIKLLAEGDETAIDSIMMRVLISVAKHGSELIAVVGHHDCAGNPVPKEQQIPQIERAMEVVKSWDTGAKVVGLYVNEFWNVEVVRE